MTLPYVLALTYTGQVLHYVSMNAKHVLVQQSLCENLFCVLYEGKP